MLIILLSLIGVSIVVITAILAYQHMHLSKHTDADGTVIDSLENPLSAHNIHRMGKMFQTFISSEIHTLLVLTLKMLIRLKKSSRTLLDTGISKIAHMIFPEKEYTGSLDENTLLSHVEEQKKEGTKGQIHL